ARLARRRRLRAAGAAGAWAYVLDGLLLAGRTPRPDRTAPDIAADLGSQAAVELAQRADHAAFAPSTSSTSNTQSAARMRGTAKSEPGTDERGTAAWRLARQVRSGLRQAVPWYRRLFSAVDPRPLWRR
ncbi:hypothetical protein AB0G02_37255, partial [Actinosynnema sp. NPDC023658]|uniref:hypothetical protein n=1 Tax=Actinosynnema sp. NPDC023658 TaxID=3155465 RepID=UPI00340036BB